MTFLKNWLVCLIFLQGTYSVFAFTASDADAIYNAYNAAFYATNANGNCYYKNDTTGGQTFFWAQAEEIEMMLDTYDRTGNADTKTKIGQICNGFIDKNGSDWTWNAYNDDITWAVIAFSRAYLVTGNAVFRNVAKSNYDAMYARAWDTNFTGGGLWFNTDRGYKSACINGPGTIAACYLYSIYGDASYLRKAQAIYAWERQWLYHTDSGAIYDGYGPGGYNTWVSSYNQGTFIGAGNFLYRITGLPFYFQDAVLATECLQNSVCSADGIFPEYGSGDFGGFNGIGARWAWRLTRDQNLWVAYGPWLNINGDAAWNVRNENNLSWEKWKTATPGGTNILLSWDCSDSVIIMQAGLTNVADALQISPQVGFVAAAQQRILPVASVTTLTLTNLGATTLGWYLANTSAWLTASATSGSLSGNTSVAVQISVVPAAVTNLASGRYYGSIAISNLASGMTQSRVFELVVAGGDAPIITTGNNAGILAPNTATAAGPGVTAFDIPNNYAFYEAGLSSGTRGFPTDRTFTSQADQTTVFQFAPYGSNNAVVLGNGYPTSATLTLTTPAAYNSISILACSANLSGSGSGTVVLNFTNGTHSAALNFNAQDWFGTTSNVAIQGFGRLKLVNSFGAENNGAGNPNLYQTTLNLAALGLNQPVASMTFSLAANAGSKQTTGIFAVSGSVMPVEANIVQGPQSVTNSNPAQGVAFNVVASGISPLSYQWFYSASGSAGTFAPLASQTGGSLTLNPVLQTTNAGYFYVTVSNRYGAVTSSVAALVVYRAPVIIRQPAPASLWRFVGSTSTWSVVANAAVPVSYYWCLNGVPIAGATASTFALSSLQAANSGNYSVVVSNSYGAITSSIVALTVDPVPAYPYAQAVLADLPLGYWRLNETGGSMAHDYMADKSGVFTPTATLGMTGNPLLYTHPAAGFGYLAGSNSCVTNIPIDFATSGNAAFTVEAWVKGGSQTSDAGLITKGNGGGGEQFNLDCGGNNHAFRFFIRDAGGGTHLATSSVVPNSQWHHLVGVCDEPNGQVYLYVDGTNAAQGTVGQYVGILNSALPMSIGSRKSGASTSYNNQFVGVVEEVAVYGYALSASQVASHYQIGTNYNSAPIVLNGVCQGNQLRLDWTGGNAPYQVQFTLDLGQPNWQNCVVSTNANTLIIPLTNSMGYYRILGL